VLRGDELAQIDRHDGGS